MITSHSQLLSRWQKRGHPIQKHLEICTAGKQQPITTHKNILLHNTHTVIHTYTNTHTGGQKLPLFAVVFEVEEAARVKDHSYFSIHTQLHLKRVIRDLCLAQLGRDLHTSTGTMHLTTEREGEREGGRGRGRKIW